MKDDFDAGNVLLEREHAPYKEGVDLSVPRPSHSDTTDRTAAVTAWSPLRNPGYRNLWVAWLTANICMWMGDVTAAWVMLGLTDKSLFVALVQTATTLPIVLLSLPCGAIADVVDRRRWFMFALLWLCGMATLIALADVTEMLSAPLLLLLVFCNGTGQAMRWTLFTAMVPDVVSREELPQALALHSLAVNGSRIIGPVAAGALLAIAGSTFIFATIAVLAFTAAIVIWRWQYTRPACGGSDERDERMIRAMWTGLQYSARSRPLRVAAVRIFTLCMQVFALIGLLPLVATGMGAQGASSYTLLFSCMGIGAIAVALVMPHMRSRLTAQAIVTIGSLMVAIAIAIVALAPNPWVAGPAIMIIGGTWLALSNVVSVSAQLALPNGLRARGMAIFMTAAMAGSAAGAASFGALADLIGVRESLLLLAAIGLVCIWVFRRLRIESAW